MKVEVSTDNIDEDEAETLMDEFKTRFPNMMDTWLLWNTEVLLSAHGSYIHVRLNDDTHRKPKGNEDD